MQSTEKQSYDKNNTTKRKHAENIIAIYIQKVYIKALSTQTSFYEGNN
jgi:hypothetical protein